VNILNPTNLPLEAMQDNLYPANLPPEAMREKCRLCGQDNNDGQDVNGQQTILSLAK
jgi:hypothetical protein